MNLYDSVGPNPHFVRIIAAEKSVPFNRIRIDLRGGENRRPEYLAKNPWGQMPMIELHDGTRLTEIIPLAEYLDEIGAGPSLVGTTPIERAKARMWMRRIDLNIIEPLVNGFRFSDGLPLFCDRIRCIPEAADGLKAIARDHLARLESAIGDRTWLCGDRLTLGDFLLFAFLTFAAKVGQPLDPAHTRIASIVARIAERPSAAA